jgi:hypothetical protein
VFQTVLGEILTVLIALEFNHTLQYVVNRAQSIIQTKIVLLIARLAAARKVVILDLQEIGVGATLGLAAIILVRPGVLVDPRAGRPPAGAKPGAIGKEDRADAHELAALAKMRTTSGAMEKTTAI